MKSILSLLQFTTILPLGKTRDLEDFARRSYLYPLSGYIIGGLAAVPVLFIANPSIAAAGAIAFLMLLTGAHHFDGLVDFGDGLMALGSREKRIQALTDKHIGAGGVVLGISVTLLLFAGLQGSQSLLVALIIGETGAKFSMAFLTSYGKPFRTGIHSYLNGHSRPYFPFIALLLCTPLVLLPLSPLKLTIAALLMIICPTILLIISERLFGGINGDIVGASNELCRACLIIALAIS